MQRRSSLFDGFSYPLSMVLFKQLKDHLLHDVFNTQTFMLQGQRLSQKVTLCWTAGTPPARELGGVGDSAAQFSSNLLCHDLVISK